MALLITPMLVIGLLVSRSPMAGECTDDLANAARTCEACAVKVSAHGTGDRFDRQVRKHANYYVMLQRAQQNTGSAAPEYSARAEPPTLTGPQTHTP